MELGRRYSSDDTLQKLSKFFKVSMEQLKLHDHRESVANLKRMIQINPRLGLAFRTAVYCVLLALLVAKSAADDSFDRAASFYAGAGSVSTNATYTMISSWRQPIQTGISSSGNIVNSSGFLAAANEELSFKISCALILTPVEIIAVTTQTAPGRQYRIQFVDSLQSAQPSWQFFGNTNDGVGIYVETNSSPSTFTFADDFTSATSGGKPSTSMRYYRVISIQP